MGAKKADTSWISFSDIMTGLMVIFMFIAIAYIMEVKKEQAQRDLLFEEFQAVKEELYEELDSAFQDDFEEWQVELDRDLSIKFTNPDILFASGQARIRPRFQEILDEFFPRYFQILLKPKFKDRISEIRIEGHTDDVPAPTFDPDPYVGNVILSQLRSAAVLKHFRQMGYYSNLSDSTEQQLQYWLTANGLSYGRTLDADKNLTAISGGEVSKVNSRRVEFRIVTTSDKLVEDVIKRLSTEN